MLPPITSTFRSVARASSSRLSSFVPTATTQARTFATVVPGVPATTGTQAPPQKATDGRQRPHLNVPVDPNHGLYAFFRRVEKDGKVTYETVEDKNAPEMRAGRSWTAAELRLKSFKDLHTLWYVLLRERNLLATQMHEGARLGIQPARLSAVNQVHKVRKSMARIKYVLNERRLAYEGAVKILEDKKLEQMVEREAKRQAHKEYLAQKAAKRAAAQKVVEGRDEAAKSDEVKAEDLAVAGLFSQAGDAPQATDSRS